MDQMQMYLVSDVALRKRREEIERAAERRRAREARAYARATRTNGHDSKHQGGSPLRRLQGWLGDVIAGTARPAH